MNSLPTRAILGAGTAVAAAVAVASSGPSVAIGLASSLALAALAVVAAATQSARLRDEQRLVYRPVYVRRQTVQRRVRLDD